MKKGGKLTIGIVSTIAVGIGIYFLGKKLNWWGKGTYNPNDEEGGTVVDDVIDNVKKVTVSTNSTPFKSKEEGNKFRAWINDTYPDYAKKIDLWREGDYDNSYIRKAYTKYGTEYEKLGKPTVANLLDVGVSLGTGYTQHTDRIAYRWYMNTREAVFYNNGRLFVYICEPNFMEACKKEDRKECVRGKWSKGGRKFVADNGSVLETKDVKDTLALISTQFCLTA